MSALDTQPLTEASYRVAAIRKELAVAEAERDTLIRAARDQGLSLRKIAAEAGVSFARVAQIVND